MSQEPPLYSPRRMSKLVELNGVNYIQHTDGVLEQVQVKSESKVTPIDNRILTKESSTGLMIEGTVKVNESMSNMATVAMGNRVMLDNIRTQKQIEEESLVIDEEKKCKAELSIEEADLIAAKDKSCNWTIFKYTFGLILCPIYFMCCSDCTNQKIAKYDQRAEAAKNRVKEIKRRLALLEAKHSYSRRVDVTDHFK